MRLTLQGDTLLERLALRLRLVPRPAAEAWGALALAGVLISAVRTGVTSRLATGPATAAELAGDRGLDPTVTFLLLDCLRAAGYVRERSGRYELTRGGRRWLDPASGLSVADFVAANGDYWSWWAGLDEVARTGRTGGQHDHAADDAYWRRYILGQRDLARLSAAYLARKIPVPAGPGHVLDLGGGHGLYSVELCRRHPALRSTVVDLPGSAAVGRELVAAAGMTDRIRYVDGDARTADLGGPFDLVLCFNLVHHLAPDDLTALFTRVSAALRPGGRLAVLDAFAVSSRRGAAAATVLNLFTFLSSGVSGYTPAQLNAWLDAAGFASPQRIAVPRIPGLALYLADRR